MNTVDLVVKNAMHIATVDAQRREIPGGWIAVDGGRVVALGSSAEPTPAAREVIDATDCLVTPGLVNTHHHIYQNLTRAFPPMTDKPLFGWLQSLYPLWRAIDEEAVHVSAFVGLAELALSGCTTSTDHLYLHPHGAGDLLTAEIEAARELGVRFHPTRGSMSLSEKDGGLPPDDVVADDDEIVAHCVMPNHDEVHRLGAAGIGVAHCPSSNLILASGISPVVDLRAAGVKVGLGVDGSSSADSASLWLEARQAMLLAKLRNGAHAGTARMALEVATIGGAGCLGREGEIGELSVDGRITHPALDEMLSRHARISRRIQRLDDDR